MKKTSPEHLVPELLASAGVEINGNRPWDIQVHNSLFCKRVVTGGSIALGESYMGRLVGLRSTGPVFRSCPQIQIGSAGQKID
jgi:hypothetical protein